MEVGFPSNQQKWERSVPGPKHILQFEILHLVSVKKFSNRHRKEFRRKEGEIWYHFKQLVSNLLFSTSAVARMCNPSAS